MNSSRDSSLNSIIKLSRQYSTATTTSDVGESLYDGDLEWDKSDFTRHLPESDALSSYDIHEMAEILRNHFLEFDMLSQIGEHSILSRQSTFSDAFPTISNEEYIKNNLPIDLDLSTKKPRLYYRSLSDLTSLKREEKELFILSKHLSLMDIKTIKWRFFKSKITRDIILTKANYFKSSYLIPQSMDIDFEPELFNTITNMNFSRLSKFAKFRLSIMKFQDKFSSFISRKFQSTETFHITDDIINTYDIIER
ncbi:unnamed protein product [Adineta steineri]|uniref:Uncharacterized protein n=1 Tax=Adineta steineri TaxID=433720 RepID=A0A818G4Y9_9BILA|nr:unnamed protein product [Adineta steineri]CAF3484106.1 unnamed protein product [Adineta steineri]